MTLVSGVVVGGEHILELVTLPLIDIFAILFLLATFFNRRGVRGVHSAVELVVTYARMGEA